MGSGITVEARQGGVKADDTFEFALRAVAFVGDGDVGSCTYSAGRFVRFAVEVVVPKAEEVGPLGASITVAVYGDLEATPKELEASQAGRGGGLSYYG